MFQLYLVMIYSFPFVQPLQSLEVHLKSYVFLLGQLGLVFHLLVLSRHSKLHQRLRILYLMKCRIGRQLLYSRYVDILRQ